MVPRRVPDEHALQHELGHGGSGGVADEVGAELPPCRPSRTPCCPAGSGAGAPSGPTMVFRATWELAGFFVVAQLQVGQLPTADRPLLLLGASGPFHAVQVVEVLLDDHVALDPAKSGSSPPTVTASAAARPTGFSVPSTKPSRSRSSKYLKPWTSSTTVTPAGQAGP